MLITTIRFKAVKDQGFVIVTAGSAEGKTDFSVQTYTTYINSDRVVLHLAEMFSTEEMAIRRFEQIRTIQNIDNFDLYEIYTCNPEDIHAGCYKGKKAGEVTGWDIKWVLGTDEGIKDYPFFDCIITKNDDGMGRRSAAEVWK